MDQHLQQDASSGLSVGAGIGGMFQSSARTTPSTTFTILSPGQMKKLTDEEAEELDKKATERNEESEGIIPPEEETPGPRTNLFGTIAGNTAGAALDNRGVVGMRDEEIPVDISTFPSASLYARGGDTTVDNERPRCCVCVKNIQTMYHNSSYTDCIERGRELLASSPDIPLRISAVVLRTMGRAYVQLKELEHAREAYQMLLSVIRTNHDWGCVRQQSCSSSNTTQQHNKYMLDSTVQKMTRDRWLIRYYKDAALLEEVDGHREEAIEQYIAAWKKQAELFGPESLEALSTYVAIAQLKAQLRDFRASMELLRHAMDVVKDDEEGFPLWVRIRLALARIEHGFHNDVAAISYLDETISRLSVELRGTLAFESLAQHLQSANLQSLDEAKGSQFKRPAQQITDLSLDLTEALVMYGDIRSERNDDLERSFCFYSAAKEVLGHLVPPMDLFYVRICIKLALLQERLIQSGNPDAVNALMPAVECLQKILDRLVQEEVRGRHYLPALIEVYEALGEAYARAKEFRVAADYYSKALGTSKSLFAPDHEVSALLQHKLSETLLGCGRIDDAYHLLAELREWCVNCPSEKKPGIPLYVVQHSLGNTYRLLERFPEALKHYEEALASPECTADAAAKILGNMAAVHLTLGNVDEAIGYNRQALNGRLERFGPDHIDVAASYGNLAGLLREKGQYKEAVKNAEKCIQIVLDLHNDPDAAGKHPFYVRASQVRADCIRKIKSLEFQRISNMSKSRSYAINSK